MPDQAGVTRFDKHYFDTVIGLDAIAETSASCVLARGQENELRLLNNLRGKHTLPIHEHIVYKAWKEAPCRDYLH